MAKLSPKHALEVYLSWQGRIGRGEFWAYGVTLNIIWLVVAGLLTLPPSPVAEYASLCWYAILIVMYAGLLVKRGHDRGRPAIFSLAVVAARVGLFFAAALTANTILSLIGLALIIYVLVDYAALPGQKGTNRYGSPPSGGGANKNPLVLGGEAASEPALSSEAPKA